MPLVIIQKLDILAELNIVNDGQLLYILKDHKLYFRGKSILSLTIDFVFANSEDSDQMPHLGLHCLPKYGFRSQQYIKGNNLVVLLTLPTLKPIK